MTVVKFTVYGQAAPAGSKIPAMSKTGRQYVRDDNPSTVEWKRQVAQAAGEAMQGDIPGGTGIPALLDGPLTLTAWFYRPRPLGHYGTGRNHDQLKPSAPLYPTSAPDTTKLVRAIEDAMQGIVYRNDAQIIRQTASKNYGEPARVEITIAPAETWH